jgi:DNA-binding response OmpR family regulator
VKIQIRRRATRLLETSNNFKTEIAEKAQEESAKILIVDDEINLRETLQDILRREGYTAATAQTGKEAIELCQKETFDVVLIDVKLPDMEGTSLLETLKKIDPNLLQIIITGYPSLENAVQSINSGADGYLVKPFKPQKLLDQIKERLNRRQKDKWENLLQKTGLSSYEAKIYLSLTMDGASEAGKLSMSSGVPRTKTYASLKKLVQIGLVLEIPGGNQRFSIAPTSNALNNFVQTWKNDLSEQAATLVELENAVLKFGLIQEEKQNSKYFGMSKEEVWSIQEEAEIIRVTGEILSKAKFSVCVVTTEIGLIDFCKTFNKILDDLCDKGIEIRIKVPICASNNSFVRDLRNVYQVENLQVVTPIFLLIVDKNKLLLSNLKTDDQKNGLNQNFGLFSQDGILSSNIFALLGFENR